MESEKKRFFPRILVLAIILIIILIVIGFVSGNIRYYETWSAPGESRGYIGRDSNILSNPDELEEVFNELNKEFPNQEIELAIFNVSNDQVMSVIKNPNKPQEADYYYFRGTYLIRRGWHKGQAYSIDNFGFDGYPLSSINPSGISSFYNQVEAYLEENNVEVSEDRPYSVNFKENNGNFYLESNFSGVREDIHFLADVDGNNFTIVDFPGQWSQFIEELSGDNISDQDQKVKEEAGKELMDWMDKYQIYNLDEIKELIDSL